jgi:cysteine synthase A
MSEEYLFKGKTISAFLFFCFYPPLSQLESSNPGGTGKDRAVKHMLDSAEEKGLLTPGMNVIEGTSGSTGICLAYQCKLRGYILHIVMPDDQAEEKRLLLEKLGAIVHIVPAAAIANKNHYVNKAAQLTKDLQGFFVNQFENVSNYITHYQNTGPEIYAQMNGHVDGFVMSSGTGGTIAGISRYVDYSSTYGVCVYLSLSLFFFVSFCFVVLCFTAVAYFLYTFFFFLFRYLKEQDPSIKVILADPIGSSLFNKVKYDVCYTSQQSERTIRKHRYDSIVEGVGLDRLTANFKEALIDDAYQINDQELVYVAHWMLRHEGLMIGSSTALNIATILKSLSSHFPEEGSNIVTISCDQGYRHLSRFWNPSYLTNYGLTYPSLSAAAEETPAVGASNDSSLITSRVSFDEMIEKEVLKLIHHDGVV